MSRQKFRLIFNTLRCFSGDVRNWKNLFHKYFPAPAESQNRKISLQPRFFGRFLFMTMSGSRMKKYFSRHRRQSGHDSLSEFPESRNGDIFGGSSKRYATP